MTKTSKLFVYGTLKRGHHNNYLLNEASLLDANAEIHGYCIFTLGGYPGICPREDYYVRGELYNIPDALWPRLDRLEGVIHERPQDGLYRREIVQLAGTSEQAYTYVYNGEPRTPLIGGSW